MGVEAVILHQNLQTADIFANTHTDLILHEENQSVKFVRRPAISFLVRDSAFHFRLILER